MEDCKTSKNNLSLQYDFSCLKKNKNGNDKYFRKKRKN
jgi:hypothetical protein